MDTWHRVYQEVYDAKLYSDYLALWMRRAKNRSNVYKGIVIGLSATGSISWTISHWFTVGACIILFIVQLLEKLEAFIVLDNEKIIKIGEYRLTYCRMLYKCEKLLMEMHDNVIDDNEAREKYFRIRKQGLEIENLDNHLKLDDNMELFHQAEKKATDYMNQHFTNQNNQ